MKVLVLLAIAALLIGCAGNAADPPGADERTPTTLRQLPFRDGLSDTVAERQIPAGTPIPIRLRSSISSATASSGDRFSAIFDENLEVDGTVVAAKGTAVTGIVIAARRAARRQHPGYLRITLASMKLNGESVPFQTSSIFLQGESHERRKLVMISGVATPAHASARRDVALDAERRLTFRLVQPLVVKD